MKKSVLVLPLFLLIAFHQNQLAQETSPKRVSPLSDGLLTTELIPGSGVWVDPKLEKTRFFTARVYIWFDEQFLGDGAAYKRRSKEFAKWKMRDLRVAVSKTLKAISEKSYSRVKKDLDQLVKKELIDDLERHWVVNGFSCKTTPEGLEELKKIPGVRKIFQIQGQQKKRLDRDLNKLLGNILPRSKSKPRPKSDPALHFPVVDKQKFLPERYQHPWYTRYLLADRVWRDFGITGKGTLNVVHDFNFLFSEHTRKNLYRNPKENPANGKDDDGNGLIDDFHGYNFSLNSAHLRVLNDKKVRHGDVCAAIICGVGSSTQEEEFGIAPESKWAGVISGRRIEASVEWAIEQRANTYSMSFSRHDLGEYRSHWRKVLEQGSFCGICFVSGAGNYALDKKVPVQMPIPQDIPIAVFAAAGVKRDFSRAPFSSKGPVKWETEHYQDGRVQKPEVCAFNFNVPAMSVDGKIIGTLKGNSYAGPMLCGTISLMVSADPDILPWDIHEILTSTATDVAQKGLDPETGYGLVNCYRAVKEVLRRKAIRDGEDPTTYKGRTDGDEIDLIGIQKRLAKTRIVIAMVEPESQAYKLGVRPGDILVRFNNQSVTNRTEWQKAKEGAPKEASKKIPVTIGRGGKEIRLEMIPGKMGIKMRDEPLDPLFE